MKDPDIDMVGMPRASVEGGRGLALPGRLTEAARRALILATAIDDGARAVPQSAPDDPLIRDAQALLARLGWRDAQGEHIRPHLLSRREVRALQWAASTAILEIAPILAGLMAAGADLGEAGADCSLLTLLDALHDVSAIAHAHLHEIAT
jgi:hypothetical protein